MIDAPQNMALPNTGIKYTSKPVALILLYHRIGNPEHDPQRLTVAPEHFAEHMQVLKRAYNVISLGDLPKILTQPVSKTIILTFDDGYHDLFSTALPILKSLDLQATAFLCGDGSQTEYWWDVLSRIFLLPGILPETLEVEIQGHKMRWNLEKIANYDLETCKRFQNWTIWSEERPTMRHVIFRRFYGLMNFLAENEKRSLLEQLKIWSGQTNIPNEILSNNEIALLAANGHVEIGGHTAYHPFLSRLSASEQKSQIQLNKAFLENIIGRSIKSFAYPFGSAGDYTDATIQLLKDCGYTLACSSSPEAVRTDSSLMTLPRLLVRDCDSNTFSRWLASWF